MIRMNIQNFLSLAATGFVMDVPFSGLPTNWVYLDGRTIGNSLSGATARANPDTQNLYAYLWNNLDNTRAPVTGGRGASATADFAANKPIKLIDVRGSAITGCDNLGGSAANRITSAGTGNIATIAGNVIGANTITLATQHVPDHTHTYTLQSVDLNHNHNMRCSAGPSAPPGANTANLYSATANTSVDTNDTLASSTLPAHSHTAITSNSVTSGLAHNNMMSFAVTYKMVRL